MSTRRQPPKGFGWVAITPLREAITALAIAVSVGHLVGLALFATTFAITQFQ